MSPAALRAFCLKLPAATYDLKWGQDHVYSVGGKMFAVAGREGEDEPRYCFKASDASFEQLCDEGVAEPAPYLARARWVLTKDAHSLPDDQLRRYIAIAHGLIAEKLTKKARAELGIL